MNGYVYIFYHLRPVGYTPPVLHLPKRLPQWEKPLLYSISIPHKLFHLILYSTDDA